MDLPFGGPHPALHTPHSGWFLWCRPQFEVSPSRRPVSSGTVWWHLGQSSGAFARLSAADSAQLLPEGLSTASCEPRRSRCPFCPTFATGGRELLEGSFIILDKIILLFTVIVFKSARSAGASCSAGPSPDAGRAVVQCACALFPRVGRSCL